LLLPTAGIVFAGTAFGLVVAGVARSREAVLPIGSIVIVTMAAVGGCWWPIDLEPPWMQSVARAFPTTWAMSAFHDLMIRRQPARERRPRCAWCRICARRPPAATPRPVRRVLTPPKNHG